MTHAYKEGQLLKYNGRTVKVLKCENYDFLIEDDNYYKVEFEDSKLNMVLKESDLKPFSIEDIINNVDLLRSVCDCGAWVTSKPADHFVWCSIYPLTGKRK